MHAVKKEATEPPINARNITKDTSDFLSGQSEPIRQVQLVSHKNKWHDLRRKIITCLFLFFEVGPPGQGNTFIGPTYFFKHVQTGSNLFKLFQTFSNLNILDQICLNLIQIHQICSNFIKLVQTWSNWINVALNGSNWFKIFKISLN